MRFMSSSEFLADMAEALNCCIYYLNNEKIVSKIVCKSLEKNIDPHSLGKAKRQELVNSTHIVVGRKGSSKGESGNYINEIYVPTGESVPGEGLLWSFPGEYSDGETGRGHFADFGEKLITLVCTLSYAASALMNMENMKATNSLYSQALFHVGNMLSNGIMLYDRNDCLLFQNTAADKLNIVRNTGKGGNDQDMRTTELHSGNALIGKILYSTIHNSFGSSFLQQESPANEMNKIIGKDPQINRVLSEIEKVAITDSTVLLRGESGTGKELYAKLIHNKSNRKSKPFVALNCAAIPENLLESELFGYEGGSFTGAKREGKIGKFEMADKGTIFLDEIGDMPLSLQVKLLRMLQERRIEPIGGNKSVTIDVRIICATHQNLENKIATGEFREDLYYRINVIPIDIPSLNSMHHDIEMLLTHYLKKYCILQNKEYMYFSYEAMEALKNYHWQGNVRELINVVEYCVTMSSKSTIEISCIPKYIQLDKPNTMKEIISEIKGTGRPTGEELTKLVSQYGNTKEGKIRLAKHLDVSLATLYRWLSKSR